MTYRPPYNITPVITTGVAEISEAIGRLAATEEKLVMPKLRRQNRIKTIQASLQIEGNTLSLEKVTALLAGKRVLGLPKEIQEVRNAFAAYEAMEKYGGWATTIKYACDGLGADVAVVTTPDNAHYDVLKQLAEYPLKLVICEKPLCTDLQQAREIVELYKAKGIPLMVNYTRRFLPYYQKWKQRFDSEELGKFLFGYNYFNRGWIHTATHCIDMVLWFKGNMDDFYIYECPDADFRIWDTAMFFEKGEHFRETRIGNMPVWEYYDKAHWYVIKNAYNFLEGKEPLKCTGEDGLRALEICFELMEGRNNNDWERRKRSRIKGDG